MDRPAVVIGCVQKVPGQPLIPRTLEIGGTEIPFHRVDVQSVAGEPTKVVIELFPEDVHFDYGAELLRNVERLSED